MAITIGFPVDANAARATGYKVTPTDWNDLMGKGNSVPGWCIKSGSGTSTAAGTTNVDTIAMASKLGALDSLIVRLSCESLTQATANIQLFNTTDTVQVAGLTASLAAAGKFVGEILIRPYQSSVLKVGAVAVLSGGLGVVATDATFVTNWTAAWTLGFRHTGVTAGGTFGYSWAVYVVKGQ